MKCLVCASEEAQLFSAGKVKGYYHCRDCGLVWLGKELRPPPAQERERYLQHNNRLDEPNYLAYLTRTIAPVRAWIKPGARGLDFGCGPVEAMKHLLEPTYQISSYDPYFFPRPELLNFRYDFVFCCEVAEHFYDPLKSFSQIDELLEPGAILAVSSRLLPPPAEFSNWSYRRDPTHVVFYTEQTVRWLAKKFGWHLLGLDSPLWILRKD